MSKTVLILEIHRQTLSALRSLSPNYTCTLGIQNHENQNHLRDQLFITKTRFPHKVWQHPPFKHKDEFKQALLNELSIHPVDFIFPIGEESLLSIDWLRNDLPQQTRIAAPSSETIHLCLNKEKADQMIHSLEIPHPKEQVVHSKGDAKAGLRGIGLPAILKPLSSDHQIHGQKAMIITQDKDLDSLSDQDFPLLLQTKVSGIRHNCMFAARNGQLIQYFEGVVLRTDKWNGTGYGVESRSIPPVDRHVDWVSTIIGKLNYNGVGCVQFLSHHGVSNFLEINPRLDAIVELSRICGFNFPQLALKISEGENLDPDLRAYPKVRTHWFLGDLRGLLSELTQSNVSTRSALTWCIKMVKCIIRFPHHLTWSMRDPMPSLYLLSNLFRSILRKLIK